jgi:hypothetical protein
MSLPAPGHREGRSSIAPSWGGADALPCVSGQVTFRELLSLRGVNDCLSLPKCKHGRVVLGCRKHRAASIMAMKIDDSKTKDAERRRAKRTELMATGQVRVPGYRRKMRCVIVDASATGARVRLSQEHPAQLPDYVVIGFEADRVEIDAAIVWTARDEMGVQFVSAFRKAALSA